jgi:hypothetical protein
MRTTLLHYLSGTIKYTSKNMNACSSFMTRSLTWWENYVIMNIYTVTIPRILYCYISFKCNDRQIT